MPLILLADRDELYRAGAAEFLAALARALPDAATPHHAAWRERLRAAQQQLPQGLPAAARALAAALDATLTALATAEAELAHCRRDLEYTQLNSASLQRALTSLQADVSVAELGRYQRALTRRQEEAEAAQQQLQTLALALDAARRTVAARETTIQELQTVIAKQQALYDATFGALEDPA